ncbi:MAG: hypothetical protein ACE5PT_08065 [Gemmatimonadales bacterium]
MTAARSAAVCFASLIVLVTHPSQIQAQRARSDVASPDASGSLPIPWLLHGGHSTVSRALIDPTFTHHAILEDELRVNYFARSDRAQFARGIANLEIAYAFSDALGAEVFIPFALDRVDGASQSRLLDIEAQPLKWSFVRRYNLIMTGVAGLVIPVGDTGDRTWRFEPHFFADAAAGPFALQGNVMGSFADNGEHEVELATSVARMFFFSPTNSAGPIVETLWELPLRATGAGIEPMLAPGLKLQLGGWYFGASYLFPLRRDSALPTEFAMTGGYHVSFSRRRSRPENIFP